MHISQDKNVKSNTAIKLKDEDWKNTRQVRVRYTDCRRMEFSL